MVLDLWYAFLRLLFGLLAGLLRILGCSCVSLRRRPERYTIRLPEGKTQFRVSEGRMEENQDGSVRRVWQNFVIDVKPQATISDIRKQIARQTGGVQSQYQDRVSFAITCCWHPYKQVGISLMLINACMTRI